MNVFKKLFGKKEQKGLNGFTGISPMTGESMCVICYHTKSEGHNPDCWYGNEVN